MLDAERGEDTSAALADLVAYAQDQLALGEPQWQRDVDAYVALVQLVNGQYAAAAAGFMAQGGSDALNASGAYGYASLAALLAGDAGSAAEAVAALDATGQHGSMVKLARARTVAGIAGLEGRHSEARGGFRGVQEELRRLDLPYPLALTDVALCAVLDPGLPEVDDAADEARGIFIRLGARAWLDRLDDVLRRGDAARPSPSEPRRLDVKDATPAS
jgi:hypothetical protein